MKKQIKKERFLPTITTISKSVWREKLKEIQELGLQKVALFLTCLEKKERKELYALLPQTRLKEIPFVHLRSDMEPQELDYFANHYQTKVFNIHPQKEYPLFYDYSRRKKNIYIENTYSLDEKDLKGFGGICLDFSHLENERRCNGKKYAHCLQLLKKYPIGCNHIGVVKKVRHLDINGFFTYHTHHLDDFSELDYLKHYPLNYFSQYIAIELENSLQEQLKAIDYIVNLLQPPKFCLARKSFAPKI